VAVVVVVVVVVLVVVVVVVIEAVITVIVVKVAAVAKARLLFGSIFLKQVLILFTGFSDITSNIRIQNILYLFTCP
jgi:hypothetical protein